jgi:hypothetical protein
MATPGFNTGRTLPSLASFDFAIVGTAASDCAWSKVPDANMALSLDTVPASQTMVDALAAYTGTVTVCPSGRGKAPDAKRQRGRAQFQCVCPTLASPIIHYLGIPRMSPELAWMVAIFWIGRKFRCGRRGSWLISWFFISRWLADGSF